MKTRITRAIAITCIALGIVLLFLGVFMHFAKGNDKKASSKKDGSQQTQEINKNEEPKEGIYPDFLWDHDWESSEPDISCTETVSFHDDGEFAYYCSCGSPVGYYDIFWEYSYNEDDRTITVMGDAETQDETIKVLFYDDFSLVLQFPDDEVRTFRSEKASDISEEPTLALSYIKDVPTAAYIAKEEDGILTLLPSNYDKDAKDAFEGMVFEMPLAEDVHISSLYVTVDNGVETDKYTVITLDENTFVNEDGSYCYALLGFDSNGCISKIVFYGVTEIYG